MLAVDIMHLGRKLQDGAIDIGLIIVPDDALSRHPFDWMKAEALAFGLRFLQDAEVRFTPPETYAAPLHDSRQGLGSYYRYQPRKIAAHMTMECQHPALTPCLQ